MKETVAIISAAGIAGSATAFGLASAGYRVLLADEIEKHPLLYVKILLLEYRIKSVYPSADVEMVLCEREASWQADIIVIAAAHESKAEMCGKIKEVVTGKIVVRMINPLNEIHQCSVAEDFVRFFPYSKIVTVCYSNALSGFYKSRREGTDVKLLVSSDDNGVVSTVMQLLKDAGFHPLQVAKHFHNQSKKKMPSICELEQQTEKNSA